jgi:hypothetical protein
VRLHLAAAAVLSSPRTSLRALVLKLCCLLGLTLAVATFAHAQFTSVGGSTSTPVPGAGHNYIQLLNETVDPGSGSLSLRLGVPIPPGRGLTVPFFFGYDSNGVHLLNVQVFPGGNGSATTWSTDISTPNQFAGWAYETPKISFTPLQFSMYDAQNSQTYYCNVSTGYVFQDAAGTRHQIPISYSVPTDPTDNPNACQYNNQFTPGLWPNSYTSGGDGHVQAAFNSNGSVLDVVDSDGTVYDFGYETNYPGFIEDRNGNRATQNNANPTAPLVDSLGRSEVTIPTFKSSSGDEITISGLSSPY